MIVSARMNAILEILNKNGKVLVKNLSKTFSVSEDQIRKDLQKLEKQDQIIRVYGGAELKRDHFKDEGMSERKKINIEKKKIIAKKAFDIIEENDNIFLDVSSINIFLAQYLAQSTKTVTIITNTLDIIKILADSINIKIIVIGGLYNNNLGGCVGSSSIQNIKSYRVNKVFMGCSGINLSDNSIMTTDLEDVDSKKTIIDISEKSYLIIENKRFTNDALCRFSTTDEIDGIITEEEPDAYIMELINEKNINLI
ncbi:MAG: DeoR/GlpR family DNA-binding transcription regulator [Spirochaetaceae bacterium]